MYQVSYRIKHFIRTIARNNLFGVLERTIKYIFKMNFYRCIAFLATLGFIEAKIIPGKCPAVSTMLDFDPTPVIVTYD